METIPTLIQLTPEERRIIEAYKADTGLSQSKGTSAAIRQIIREWNRLKAAEMAVQIRRNQKQAA